MGWYESMGTSEHATQDDSADSIGPGFRKLGPGDFIKQNPAAFPGACIVKLCLSVFAYPGSRVWF